MQRPGPKARKHDAMTTPPESSIYRSPARSVGVAFRLSPEDRAELRRRATDQGLTVQAYLERVALGRLDATALPSGRPRRPAAQEDLPLTG